MGSKFTLMSSVPSVQMQTKSLPFCHGVSTAKLELVSGSSVFVRQHLLKTTGKSTLDNFFARLGIHRSWTSGLEKWEAPDPAEWIQRGYAIVNTDARGTFKSEGDMPVYGTQEGRDGHDAIEWIGTQSWCNGSVGMAGNSWLGSTQWYARCVHFWKTLC